MNTFIEEFKIILARDAKEKLLNFTEKLGIEMRLKHGHVVISAVCRFVRKPAGNSKSRYIVAALKGENCCMIFLPLREDIPGVTIDQASRFVFPQSLSTEFAHCLSTG